MSPDEYSNLEKVEKQHWYYAGKREIVRYWLGRTCPRQPRLRLLDCGAGTGAFATEMQAKTEVVAMDDHQEALLVLRKRLTPGSVVQGSCTAIPFEDNCFDALTALDVLEHIPSHHQAAQEMVRVVKPGGLILVTVPALRCLWSDWDVSLHHQRRYSKPELLDLFHDLPVTVDHCAYINVLAMPLVWLARKCRSLGMGGRSRAEDHLPPRPVNWLLRQAFVRLATTRIQIPFGVGLILVARKHEAHG